MSRSLFASFFKGGLFGSPDPPDSIPLRILGLDVMPSERSAIVAAFRRAVLAAHPDIRLDDSGAHEDSTVAELVWAREFLIAKLPAPVTDKPARGNPVRIRNAYPPVTGRLENDAPVSTRNGDRQRKKRIKARPDRYCERCHERIAAERGDARYCSNACRQAAYRQRRTGP